MKKIKIYDGKTLETFVVHLSYESGIKGVEIEDLATLTDQIKRYYPIKPLLGLLKRRPIEIQFSNLTFSNENKTNHLELGEDYLVFRFNKYESWELEVKKILFVLEILNKAVKIPNINKIVLTYVDIFSIDCDGFDFNKYFTFPIIENKPPWEIYFHDIFLGLVPFEKEFENYKYKVVLRLKGRGIKENKYSFRLESVASVDNFTMTPNVEKLKSYLQDCHDWVINYFLEYLTSEYREKLEIVIEEG